MLFQGIGKKGLLESTPVSSAPLLYGDSRGSQGTNLEWDGDTHEFVSIFSIGDLKTAEHTRAGFLKPKKKLTKF